MICRFDIFWKVKQRICVYGRCCHSLFWQPSNQHLSRHWRGVGTEIWIEGFDQRKNNQHWERFLLRRCPTWCPTWWPTWCPTCRWTRWPIWRWTRWLTWRWTRWLTWLPTMVGSHGLIGRRAASEKLGPGGPLDFMYYLYLMSWGGDNGKVLTQIWISKLNKTWYLWRADLLHKTWFLSSLLRRDRRNLWRAKSKPLFFL